MKTIHTMSINIAVTVLLVIGIMSMVIACDDDSDTNNTSNTYQCANGTPASGTAPNATTTKCSSCNAKYLLSDDSCVAFSLTNVANVDDSDDSDYKLAGVAAVTTATIADTTYLFVVGGGDKGVSVFTVGAGGALTNVDNIADDDNASYALDRARSATTATIGGTTYLFIVSEAEHGVSVFSVGSTGALTNVANINDSDNTSYELKGARSVTTAVVGGTTYLFVAGRDDNGVSVFSVGSTGALTNVANIDDSDNINYELALARWVTTTTIDDTTYLFVAGWSDDGISVFSVSSAGNLTNVANIDDSDDASYELDGAYAITTTSINNATYLFVAARNDNGISVFSVGSDGTLTNVDNIDDSDDATYNLSESRSITTATISGTTYLFATGSNDNGYSVFAVGSNGTLTNVANVDDGDDADYQLSFARTVATTTIDNTTYLFVGGRNDNGVSVFSIP